MFWPEVVLRVAIVAMITAIVATVIWSFHTTAEYKSFLSNYDAEIAVLDHSRADSSWPEGKTVKIKNDGVAHICKNVHLEDLRQLRPILCEDGTIITAK